MGLPQALAFPSSIQNKTQLSAVTLTAAYNSTVTFTISLFTGSSTTDPNFKTDLTHLFQTLNLYLSYTTGTAESGTSLKFKVEVGQNSADLTEVYQGTALSDSSGTITVNPAEYVIAGGAAATNYKRNVALKITDPVVKVSFKETGVSSNFGTLTVKTLVSQL